VTEVMLHLATRKFHLREADLSAKEFAEPSSVFIALEN
jgi:hypothetical protein